jgi:hypothetical protein
MDLCTPQLLCLYIMLIVVTFTKFAICIRWDDKESLEEARAKGGVGMGGGRGWHGDGMGTAWERSREAWAWNGSDIGTGGVVCTKALGWGGYHGEGVASGIGWSKWLLISVVSVDNVLTVFRGVWHGVSKGPLSACPAGVHS